MTLSPVGKLLVHVFLLFPPGRVCQPVRKVFLVTIREVRLCGPTFPDDQQSLCQVPIRPVAIRPCLIFDCGLCSKSYNHTSRMPKQAVIAPGKSSRIESSLSKPSSPVLCVWYAIPVLVEPSWFAFCLLAATNPAVSATSTYPYYAGILVRDWNCGKPNTD